MSFLIDLLSKILATVLRILPLSVRWRIAGFLAWLWWDVLKLRRFTVFRNLSIVFPKMPKSEKLKLARLSLQHMCYNFVDFCLLPVFNEKFIQGQFVLHGREHYQKAQAAGKGVLFMSLHTGGGDVALAMMAINKLPLTIISKRFKNKFLQQFWFGVREKLGNKFIDPHGTKTAFEILKTCKRNEGVVFVIDQFMGRPYGIETTFFGRKTGTAYGLALFALKTKAPVLPLYTYRDEKFINHLVIGEEIRVSNDPNQDRDLQILQMTQEYNSVLEDLVRKYPDQWMWVHRRWKRWE